MRDRGTFDGDIEKSRVRGVLERYVRTIEIKNT